MRLKSPCLAVTENKESHTAANYRENVDEVTEEFGIKEKIVKTVTDNENKMKAVFDDEERTGCMAHIIHNSVTNGFKQVEEVKELIEKNRRIATKYHKSYAFKIKVEEEQIKRGLPTRALIQDVPTRWGSTRASTSSFLDKEDKDQDAVDDKGSDVFKDKFLNMDAINSALRKIKFKGDQKLSQYLLTEADKQKIFTVNKFLTDLDIFSTTLGGDKYITSSVVFPVMAAMKKLLKEDSSDPMYIASLKEAILKDFVARANSNVDGDFLLLATALDPQWKDLKVINKSGREKCWQKIRTEMDLLRGEEVVARDKIDGPKPKRRLLDISVSDDESDDENGMDELTRF